MQALSLRKTAFSIFQTWDSVEMAGDRWPMDRYPHTAIHWGMDPQRAAGAEHVAALGVRLDLD